ncbi:MucR family transcriptional regulator [Methylobacterium terricola]|uniref:MucR family transcriptional regulator n=1 Tax=Methylobacterium terricola TaxID=2583531 RepID=A0A5C4L529_9HYPH|nr:MucR family transcriptional regulator [Methylobacterium terricola]TNC05119.1 MucR family transcriptional regulator [Methylobacterium terricola]
MNYVTQNDLDFIGLAADIIGAYVAKNSVRPTDLPDLIASTHAALTKLGALAAPAQVEKLTPPFPIRKTVTPDHLISLEDGRQYKSLKRHLSSRGMTPEEHRQKWGLPHDYPMVAANYAAKRSELAKSLGLGQIRRDRAAARKAEAETQATAPARRGRPKKAEAAAE